MRLQPASPAWSPSKFRELVQHLQKRRAVGGAQECIEPRFMLGRDQPLGARQDARPLSVSITMCERRSWWSARACTGRGFPTVSIETKFGRRMPSVVAISV